jgi:hypothetical protein
MCPLFNYLVSHTDVGLHGSIGILLLHEINSNHSLPLIGAGLVQYLKVLLLTPELQPEENESSAEIGMFLPDLEVDFVEGSHVHFLVMLFDEVSLFIVLLQLTK